MDKINKSDLPPVNEMSKQDIMELRKAIAKAKRVKKIKSKYHCTR